MAALSCMGVGVMAALSCMGVGSSGAPPVRHVGRAGDTLEFVWNDVTHAVGCGSKDLSGSQDTRHQKSLSVRDVGDNTSSIGAQHRSFNPKFFVPRTARPLVRHVGIAVQGPGTAGGVDQSVQGRATDFSIVAAQTVAHNLQYAHCAFTTVVQAHNNILVTLCGFT